MTFPLVVDKGGRLSKRFSLFDSRTNKSAKAVALVDNGRIVYTKKVTTTEVPARVAPWIDKILAG